MKKIVVNSASAYNKKYYFNPKFDALPDKVKTDLKIITVCTAEKIKGIFIIGFFEDGRAYFETASANDDFNFDDIGAALEINRISREEEELIKSLELWFKYKKLTSNDSD